nr:hypothetical protein [Tanacetum cinerariifolium]
MSRDVLTIGSTMRIPLLYRGEYSQWVKRFMNYLEEQTDEEAMINSIKTEWKQYETMTRQNKNLMDINIDALYNILKQNQGDVNDAMGSKKKTVVVTSDPLALIAEKTNVSRSKEKVVVSSDSEGSEADDFKIFHDAIESASENFIENHIDSQRDYDKSDVDHNNSEEKDQLVDKLIRKFNKMIVKCQNRVEKANQQSKDF